MPEIRVRHLDPNTRDVTPIGRKPLSDQPITIGRAEGNDIVLTTNRVSRAHCVVEPTTGGFRVRDTGSTFGTLVNGERIDIQILTSGDVIGVAGFELQFVEPERDTAVLPPDPAELQRTIDLLIEQRDAARAERDDARRSAETQAEHDDTIRALTAELETAQGDARSARDALDVVRAELSASEAQRTSAVQDRDDARALCDTLTAEIDTLRAAADDGEAAAENADSEPAHDHEAERARWASMRSALESTISALEADLERIAGERDAARQSPALPDVSSEHPPSIAPPTDEELDTDEASHPETLTLHAEESAPAIETESAEPSAASDVLVSHLDAVRTMARHLLNVDAVLREREDAFADLDARVHAAETDEGEDIDLELLNARDLEAAAFEAAHDDRDAALSALRDRLDTLDAVLDDEDPSPPAAPAHGDAARRSETHVPGRVIGRVIGVLLGVGLGVALGVAVAWFWFGRGAT